MKMHKGDGLRTVHCVLNGIKNRLHSNRDSRERVKRYVNGINEHNRQFVRAVEQKTKARIDKLLEEFAWKETE